MAKTFTLPSQQRWTLQATGLDQRDSVLYSGRESFPVLAGRTTGVALSLEARYSSMKVRFPVRDSLTRFVLLVDGRSWGDSSFTKQTRVGDTVLMDRDYLTASSAGVVHSFGLRAYGRPWDVDTLLYSLDTTLSIVSGSSVGRSLVLKWVGPNSPPPGRARLSVTLGTVGQVTIDVAYQDTAVSSSHPDFGIPWNDSVSYGRLVDSRDGRSYRTIQIGTQTWMAENLNYGRAGVCPSADGSIVEGSVDSCSKYGRLYMWAETMQGASPSNAIPSGVQGVCPDGWHVPSDAEWQSLEVALGMDPSTAATAGVRGTTEGTMLKSKLGWRSNTGTDTYGFRALPAGGVFGEMFNGSGFEAYFWTTSEYDSNLVWDRDVSYGLTNVARLNNVKILGFSVRCRQD
ncbi:MAG: hypothetical protein H6686_08460 [Fibrobacteria bacterium]|nr:hypothetical protein [Fibrobacteria bacterium]